MLLNKLTQDILNIPTAAIIIKLKSINFAKNFINLGFTDYKDFYFSHCSYGIYFYLLFKNDDYLEFLLHYDERQTYRFGRSYSNFEINLDDIEQVSALVKKYYEQTK